ncbi:pentatricopeptide repeat-containing protein At5g66500, mitochondrial [Carica papaya]|uniref:pentatricopeptide repeat-containing protein At5g66500, mitochondrial n=1 Tax=Carica papaya TaxID=3649 RepID=UPI000B8CB985|nr:pentatricopeptide repeat-containing protein At5g66500, mitochondrial [Carica papaya]
MSKSYYCTQSLNFPLRTLELCYSRRPSDALIKHQNRHVDADHLFEENPHREIHSLNSQLASYVRNGNVISAWALFRRMNSACSALNAHSFTPVLGACSVLPGPERGKQVHGLMIKTGADTGTVSKTALMDMYSKYGQLGNSVRVFEEMEFRDVVSWNALLSSFLRQGLTMEALGVFEAMKRENVEVSEFTLCSVLKACASSKDFKRGKQVHGLVVVMGRDLVVLGTALIDFYSSVGQIREAMKAYSSLNDKTDEIMLNSLIAGCVRTRNLKEAFSVISTIKPSIRALTSILSACSDISDLWIGKQIHCVTIRFRFTTDTQLCNVVLDMYAKCGKIRNARSLFDGIQHKDVVSWTSMIDAYGVHGYGLEALELFKKMSEHENGVSPNSVTFLVVLSACGHAGLVQEGRECLELMTNKYGIEAEPEHYACVIDILSRAGEIEDVWCLFSEMVRKGSKSTAAVWAALLNACSLNLDVSRGEFAAKNLLEIEPKKPGNFVLVSNFYAAIGKWDSVDKLRGVMKEKGLLKEVGSSKVPRR